MFVLIAAILAGFYAFGYTHFAGANLFYLAVAFFFLHLFKDWRPWQKYRRA